MTVDVRCAELVMTAQLRRVDDQPGVMIDDVRDFGLWRAPSTPASTSQIASVTATRRERSCKPIATATDRRGTCRPTASNEDVMHAGIAR
jgi:hypothetical protein